MTDAPQISPLAVVEGDLGPGCSVGPFAVISAGAHAGEGCVIHAHAVIADGVTLGAGVQVLPGAVVGRAPGGAGATALEPAFSRRLVVGDGCAIGAHATLYFDVEIGDHTLIGDSASIREGARIGRRCIVSRCVTLNYDVSVGDRVKIMDNTHITGGTRIGDGAFVSTMVATTNDNSPLDAVGGKQVGPQIGAGAVVGAGAVLLPGVVIGIDAVIAAGAVVTHDVDPGATVFGMPARAR